MSDLNSNLRAIVQHAYANAPAFKQIMDAAGLTPADIQTVDDLPKLPITSKDKLVQMQQANPPFGGWLAVPISQLQRIYFSPGPLYDPQASPIPTARRAGYRRSKRRASKAAISP